MCKVSIIISCYKDRGYLEDAINSALTQTFDDYEIILSSDGNADMKAFADKYGLRFSLAPKRWHSTALNAAVKIAKGEWIKECHDDDLLTENCLSDMVANCDGADLLYAKAYLFNNILRQGSRIQQPPTEVRLETLLPVFHNPINASTIMFRRDVFLAVGGFDPTLKHSEEYEFYLNLLCHNYKFKYVDSVVSWYRYHDEQDTHEFNKVRHEIKIHILKRFFKYANDKATEAKERRSTNK